MEKSSKKRAVNTLDKHVGINYIKIVYNPIYTKNFFFCATTFWFLIKVSSSCTNFLLGNVKILTILDDKLYPV